MNLPRPWRRRRQPPEPNRPTAGAYLADAGHRDFFHPVDHDLPQGTVNRADELVWVATRVELHAQAGTLDEGTGHILDAQINHRHAQWDDAVVHQAAIRMRTAKALHAEEAEHLTRLLHELHELRLAADQARAENEHWRGVLQGRPLTSVPTTSRRLLAAPSTAGVTLADPTAASPVAPWRALGALEPSGDHHHPQLPDHPDQPEEDAR